ncbi:MAG TPA: NADH pyrophosphatase zinc ribbon domain-containing protein, partial [Xanthobacteraceae bacterium]|nr:NADH pyrophosphatase zinc ribbon domain-containing protein [Xanthobacteraceae bacterium]
MLSRPDLGVPPYLGYTGSVLDRAADRRTDAAAIAAFEADPRARIHLVGGELVVLRKSAEIVGTPAPNGGDDPAFTFAEAGALAPWRERVFLGLRDGASRFAAGIDKEAAEALKSRDDLLVTDLRTVATGGLVAPEHLPPLAEAKAVLGWHARHRFCANCGTPSHAVDAGWRRDCPCCGTQHFPRTDPVVIMLAIDRERCLLGRSPPPRMWSCLAGFVEPGETLEEA